MAEIKKIDNDLLKILDKRVQEQNLEEIINKLLKNKKLKTVLKELSKH